MKYFKQLNKILNFKQKKSFVYLTILMFISMSFEILTLNSLLILLNIFSDPSSIEGSKVVLKIKSFGFDYDIYLQVLIIFFVIFFVKTIINIFITWNENYYIYNTRADLSHKFFKGYLYLPRIFHLRTNISETIKNITIEVDHLIASIHAIIIILMETIVLIGLVLFLFFINFKIALISFSSLLILSFIINLFNSSKILGMGKDRVKYVQSRLKHVLEGLGGAKAMALTGALGKVIDDFNKSNFKLASISTSIGFRNALPRPLFEIFILSLLIIFFILALNINTDIKEIIPTIGIFLSAAYRLAPSFGKIMSNLQRFQFNIQSADKLSKDIERFSLNKMEENNGKKLDFKNKITFENVGYSYNKNLKLSQNFIIKKTNLEISKGSKVGVIGKSGIGKSTFLDILMGLIKPQEGKILIDGVDIETVKNSWQKIIGCVPQDVFISDASLKKNIGFGLPEDKIDIAKINKAIEISNLKEFTNSLKHGIETLVGEKGSRISGGQRQRLGIARAIYHDPKVLIFDEATNALDNQTEQAIIQEIFSQSKNKTIIFVSHNIENLKHCDSIYEIKDQSLKKLEIYK